MNFIKAICIATFSFVLGCSIQLNPDAKEDLGALRSELSSYVIMLTDSPKPTVVINQFYLLMEHWEELKEVNCLPKSLEKSVNNGLYFYKYIIVSFDGLRDMNPEKDRSFEEEKKMREYWQSEATKSYEEIDNRYWSRLEKLLRSEGSSGESIELLEELKNKPIEFSFHELNFGIEIAGYSLRTTLEELAVALD